MPSLSSKAEELKAFRFQVFVYGTLRPGGYYYRRICQGRVPLSLPAQILGQLFHLQLGYPALCAGSDWVRGDVLAFNDPALMQDIDNLEGYDPDRPAESNEYLRMDSLTFDLNRQLLGTIPAYWMQRERIQAEGGQHVPSGDWHLWTGSQRLS